MTPRFGDPIVNTYASDDNPNKRAIFVRHIKRSGRENPGNWWQLTDGNGRFWLASSEACVIERQPWAVTPQELRRICDSLNDKRGIGGQTRLAELLGWNDSTIRKKLSGKLRISKSDALAIRAAARLKP